MKITKRQLRRIIKESMGPDEIYLDYDAAASLGLPYNNDGEKHFFTAGELRRLSSMTQYDAQHQAIFNKHRLGADAIGRGYGWWVLR